MEKLQLFYNKTKFLLSEWYEKSHSTLLGPAIIGVLIFGLFLDFSILEPSNTSWLLRDGGDLLQNYIGSYAFRIDEWHFPLTKTTYLFSPEGASIVFTDSNPLMSIIAKCFRSIFPPEYQFIGIWFLLCWILQSIFGYLIIKQLTGNKHYALISTVLFNLLPTEYARLGHANLVAFWTVLWAIYLFINQQSENKKQWQYFILFALCAMIHAYFLFMVLFIALTWYGCVFFEKISQGHYMSAIRFMGIQTLFGMGLILWLWVIGYFYNVGPIEGLNGFGYYSMNLNAPFNSMYGQLSKFVNPLPSIDGQYEGYQYLGFGFIALLGFITIESLKKDKFHKTQLGIIFLILCLMCLLLKQNEITIYQRVVVGIFFAVYGIITYTLFQQERKTLFFLMIPATLAYLYALSYKVALGEQVLLERMPDPGSFYYFFFQSARSSGRFFWVTMFVLLISGVYLLFRYAPRKAWAFLLLFIVVQYVDISVNGFMIPSNDRSYASVLDESSQNQIKSSSSLIFLNGFNMEIASFGLLQHKPLNKFYVSRENSLSCKERLKKEPVDFQLGNSKKDALYLMDSPFELPLNKACRVYHFYGGYLSVPSQKYKSKEQSIVVNRQSADSLDILLTEIKNSPLIIVAVKDDAATKMPFFFKQYMDSVYHTSFSQLDQNNSYLAVFVNGQLNKEILSKEHAIDYAPFLLKHQIYVKSAGRDYGNDARIEIDGIDIAFNHTGMNVVCLSMDSYDEESWKTYCFDTSGREYDK